MRTDPGRTPATLEKLGDKLTRKVWDAVVCNDRRLARLCALDSPAAAAIRLYGPSGAAWAVGISPTERLAAVAGATTASSGLRQTSNGYVETAADIASRSCSGGRRQGARDRSTRSCPTIFRSSRAPEPELGGRSGRTGVHAPPQPRFPLGPVGELLWRRVISTFGLPAVLRCLAALWRLPDEDGVVDSHGSAAVAAGIERMVCQRANLTTGRFADIAAGYRVKEAAVRAADTDLQKFLRLGPERWW